VSDTRDHLRCASVLARSVSTLGARMTLCERQQADNAFRILHPRRGAPPPPRFDKEGCVQALAKAPFDLALGKLQGAGVCPPAALVNAHELADALVAGQSTPGSPDGLNAALYCDATSGTLIDPAASTGGYVPRTSDNLRCSNAVGRSLMRLVRGVIACHLRLARASFNNQPVAERRGLAGARAEGLRYGSQLAVFVKGLQVFDEEACERRARARYVRSARAVTGGGMCPPCLDLTAQVALGDAALATVEQESGRIFICPGGTTSTTTSTTTGPPTSTTERVTTTTQPPPTSTTATTTTRPRTTTTERVTTTTQAPPTSTTATTTTRPGTTTTERATTTTRPPPTSTTATTTTRPRSTTTSTTLLPCGGRYPACFGSCPAGLKCGSEHFLGSCVCE